ncbi:MAG: DegT/DnrJ/EryC1/StrS family aminotransferase [Candidatus Aenigmarchaeota archaeon]|nr:DegT/DnrJ/EryC1/StrS family aminotransferase [Candidatus Aenigmarchaeota archaeon]
MKVPLVDLKVQYSLLKDEIDGAIQRVIDNTEFIKGNDLKEFEEEFAKFCGKKFAIGCSSGTTALELAFRVSGISPGDEIITVANTFTATASTIVNVGASPKFIDVDEDTFNMSIGDIEKNISQKTKAIVPVHLYGQPSDMAPIMEIAEKHNLTVIEDCAQAHGAEYEGKRIPVSNIGCFSFYPSKNLGAFGDAGCVVTDDEMKASMASMLLDAGRVRGKKYEHDLVGFNYRMDNIQAAILNVKLKYLQEFNTKRRKNAKLYNDLLSELKGKINLPFEADYSKHVYYVYTIKANDRDKLALFLGQNGITTQIYYPIPLHLQKAYRQLGYKEGDFPVTEKLSKEVLSLPMYPELTEEQIRFVVEKIKSFFSS